MDDGTRRVVPAPHSPTEKNQFNARIAVLFTPFVLRSLSRAQCVATFCVLRTCYVALRRVPSTAHVAEARSIAMSSRVSVPLAVAVRIRPPQKHDGGRPSSRPATCPTSTTTLAVAGGGEYEVDRVFGPDASQEQVRVQHRGGVDAGWRCIGVPCVRDGVVGSLCILVY